MLNIRKEQMDAFAVAGEQQFVQRLIAQIRLHFAEQTARLNERVDGETRLQEYVRKRFRQAEEFGIEYESDHAAFVMLVLANMKLKSDDTVANAGFLAWTRPILEREDVPGRIKMTLIEHRLQRQAESDERATWLSAVLEAVRKEFG